VRAAWLPPPAARRFPAFLHTLRPFSLRVRTAHRAAAEQVVRVIRWATARDEGREAIGERTDGKGSEDGATWYRFSTGPDAARSDIGWGAFDFDTTWTSYVRQRLDAGDTEPVGHELWQERKMPRDPNQRAKLVEDMVLGETEPEATPAKYPERVEGGKKGGKLRPECLSPERRREIAQ